MIQVCGFESYQSNNPMLLEYKCKINATKFWNFLSSKKFSALSELLEIVPIAEIENREYPWIFYEIYELRVFELMRQAFNSKEVQTKLKVEHFKELKIDIGMHDCDFYTIYEM